MPMCMLNTNVSKEKVNEAFAKELSQQVANIVESEEKTVTLQINPDQIMVRAGSTDPVAYMAVHAYNPDYFTEAMRLKWLSALTSFLSEKLGINETRVIVSFHHIPPTHVGLFGKLVSQLK